MDNKLETESRSNLLPRIGSAAEYADARATISDTDSPLHTGIIASGKTDQHTEEDDEDIFEQVKMILRKRRGWGLEDSLSAHDLDLLEDDDVLVEEDDGGCPLPSTPEDTQLIEAEVSNVLYESYFNFNSNYCVHFFST